MTQEEYNEAPGWVQILEDSNTLAGRWDQAKRIADLERQLAEAREECARIAESERVDAEATGSSEDAAYNQACVDIAEQIRNLARKP